MKIIILDFILDAIIYTFINYTTCNIYTVSDI